MPIRCPNCQADNRDGAKFCHVCGTALTAPPPQVVPPLQPGPQQPLPAQQPQPPLPAVQPPPVIPVQPPAPTAHKFGRGVLVDGEVKVVDPERQEKGPFDPGRTMVIASFGLLLLSACGIGAAFSLALWIVLLILGVSGLGCIASLLLAPLYALIGPIINWLKGDRMVPVLNFQVMDDITGQPVDVILIRERGGGNIRVGDRVRVVSGRWKRRSGVVRAYKVKVYESRGHRTDYTIRGIQPWPMWIGLMALALVVGALIYAAIQLGVLQ
jgi:hypothetical protein